MLEFNTKNVNDENDKKLKREAKIGKAELARQKRQLKEEKKRASDEKKRTKKTKKSKVEESEEEIESEDEEKDELVDRSDTEAEDSGMDTEDGDDGKGDVKMEEDEVHWPSSPSKKRRRSQCGDGDRILRVSQDRVPGRPSQPILQSPASKKPKL